MSAVAKAPASERSVRRIQRSSGLVAVDFGELWRYRELLSIFIWRDVKARYKQTFLGPFWAIFRPFVTMIMFSAIFGGLAGITSGSDIPYPLFVYAGLLPWTYFASAVSGVELEHPQQRRPDLEGLFPAPLRPVLGGDGAAPGLRVLADHRCRALRVFPDRPQLAHRVPAVLPRARACSPRSGSGCGSSGITVRYRDAGFALPFVVQLWMYATPIIYPVSKVPPEYRWLLAINPMTSVVNGFRWSLFGTNTPSPVVTAISSLVVVLTVVTGLFWFRRTERTVADII